MNKTEQQAQRRTMEKLKIYGLRDLEDKDSQKIHIATVYVNKDKEVVVEAKDSKVKEDLLKAIYAEGNVHRDGYPVFFVSGPAPTEELRKKEEEDRKKGKIWGPWITYARPGDPDFLVGLYFGVEDTLVGDYYIWDYEIIEE